MRSGGRARQGNCLVGVACQHHGEPERFERLFEQPAILLLIVDDQNGFARTQVAHHRTGGAHHELAHGNHRQFHGEAKFAAAPGLASYRDIAPHQPNKLAGNREAEPDAGLLHLPFPRLLEGCKNARGIARRNARAGIAHRHLQFQFAAGCRDALNV